MANTFESDPTLETRSCSSWTARVTPGPRAAERRGPPRGDRSSRTPSASPSPAPVSSNPEQISPTWECIFFDSLFRCAAAAGLRLRRTHAAERDKKTLRISAYTNRPSHFSSTGAFSRIILVNLRRSHAKKPEREREKKMQFLERCNLHLCATTTTATTTQIACFGGVRGRLCRAFKMSTQIKIAQICLYLTAHKTCVEQT